VELNKCNQTSHSWAFVEAALDIIDEALTSLQEFNFGI
jgi:hypothetical protein